MTSLFQTASGAWHWASVWALVGWFVAGGLLLISLRINRNDRIAAFQNDQSKVMEISETKRQLGDARREAAAAHLLAETITKYQAIAKMNAWGKTEIISANKRLSNLTIEAETPISRLMMHTTVEGNGAFNFKTTDDAITIYKQVIERFPDFPFSYYGMAMALNLRNDPEWRHHAEKAVSIFEKTTSLPEHQQSHDELLGMLRNNLRNNGGVPKP